jgi:hypothetical protein
MSKQTKITIAIILYLTNVSFSKASGSLFSSSTENALDNTVQIPGFVLREVIQANPDDREPLDECLEMFKYKKNDYTKLFIASSVNINNDGVADYFVRPAIEPHCHAFYGAHSFSFWFVTIDRVFNGSDLTAELIFAGSGDGVKILNGVSHKYNNIETVYCSAFDCSYTTYKFNGNKYIASECFKQRFDDKRKYYSSCSSR